MFARVCLWLAATTVQRVSRLRCPPPLAPAAAARGHTAATGRAQQPRPAWRRLAPTRAPRRTAPRPAPQPAARRQQLSDALVRDSMAVFPVAPGRVTNVEGPIIDVRKVGGTLQ